MTDYDIPDGDKPSGDHPDPMSKVFPEPVIQPTGRKISLVWVIPLLAVLIGAWLAYQGITEKGPTITIAFDTAEGLEAGKTKIKYKDVDLGKVDKILLSDDRKRVVVRAELDKQAADLLTENTRFWVVRARVAATEVKGLSTLFSGAYIAMDPGSPGTPLYDFIGLQTPPIVTSGEPGRHFILMSKRRSSLDVGSPVYYRQIQVGEVVAYQLGPEGQTVRFNIFIRAPYDEQVYNNTLFWNVSGLDFSLSVKGIELKTETLSTLLMGGIAFNLPEDEVPAGRADENSVFILYTDVEASRVKHYQLKTRWLIYFNGSVRGLIPGAPVEFRGIPIGKVIDVKLDFDESAVSFDIPVIIEIEPERIFSDQSLNSKDDLKPIMDQLVAKGLRAQLKSGNLLTGQKLVEFDMHVNAPPANIIWEGEHPKLPSMPGSVEAVTTQIASIIDKLDKLPFEAIADDLHATLRNTKALTGSPALPKALAQLNKVLDDMMIFVGRLKNNVSPELVAVLDEAQNTLRSARTVLDADSDLQYKVKAAMEEVSKSARSLRILTEYLETHPEALIFGKEER